MGLLVKGKDGPCKKEHRIGLVTAAFHSPFPIPQSRLRIPMGTGLLLPLPFTEEQSEVPRDQESP